MPPEVEWYDDDPDLSEFSQGDVLRGIPFPRWPTFETGTNSEKWAILRPLRSGNLSSTVPMNRLPNNFQARARRDVPDAFATFDQSEYVASLCQIRDVIVLSRSCSLDNPRRKHVVVAPVKAISDLSEAERSEGKLNGLRSNQIPQAFYLPEGKRIQESLVDLLMMTYIHRNFLQDGNVRDQLVARLSPFGTMRLQMQLAEHFGTKFGYDHEDACPSSGNYSCSACFHAGRATSKREFVVGYPFWPLHRVRHRCKIRQGGLTSPTPE